MGCAQSSSSQRHHRERLSLAEKLEIENEKVRQLQRDLLEGAIGLEKSHDLIGEIMKNGAHYHRPVDKEFDTPSPTDSGNSSNRCSPTFGIESVEQTHAIKLRSPTEINFDATRSAEETAIPPSLEKMTTSQQHDLEIMETEGKTSIIQNLDDSQQQQQEEEDKASIHKSILPHSENDRMKQVLLTFPLCTEGGLSSSLSVHKDADRIISALEEEKQGQAVRIEGRKGRSHEVDDSEEIVANDFDPERAQESSSRQEENTKGHSAKTEVEDAPMQVDDILKNQKDLSRFLGSGKRLLPPLKSVSMPPLSMPTQSPSTAAKVSQANTLMEFVAVRRDGNVGKNGGSKQFITLHSNGRMLFFNSEDDCIDGENSAITDELNMPKLMNRKSGKQTQCKCIIEDIPDLVSIGHKLQDDLVDSVNARANINFSNGVDEEGNFVSVVYKKRKAQTWKRVMSLELESNVLAKKLLNTIHLFKS